MSGESLQGHPWKRTEWKEMGRKVADLASTVHLGVSLSSLGSCE